MGTKALDVGKILESDGLLSHFLSPYEFRPQQLMMAQKIEEALKHEEALLIEAGTGVGKTLAYLIPALLSRKRVVVSTGTKNLQEQIKEKEIPFLKGLFPFPFKVSFLKGRSNYLCLYRYRHFEPSWVSSKENQTVLEEIHSWVDKTPSGDRAELLTLSDQSPLWKELSVTGEQCLGGRCDYFNECFVTQMRQEAMKADLLIVNHHLFFADLALREEANGKILPPFEAVIFDEAHLLEEIARPFFGRFISSYKLEELERDFHREMKIIGKMPKKIGHGLKHIREASDTFFGELKAYCNTQGGMKKGTDELKERRMLWNPKECSPILLDSGLRLIDLLKQMEKKLSFGGESSEGKRSLVDRTRSIHTELSLLLKEGSPGSVSWVEVRGRGVFLQSTPVDISEVLGTQLFQEKLPFVLTSATLAVNGSFNFLKRGLGIPNAEEIQLDSPFDFKNQLRFYFPAHMVHPRNSGFVPWAAQEIVKIIKRTKGRAFVLVTSYRHLEEVYAICKGEINFPLLKQGDQPRHQLLQEFQSVVPSVLFATTSFWQGVDVQGTALSCVIILKLPFASPEDPLTVGKTIFLRERGENPFYAYQLPKAVIQLKQGVGRLIRTGKDRGIIALLDKRVLDAPYGRSFLKSLPSAPWTRSEEEIERFLNLPHKEA